MDVKDSYLHGTVGVVKSINVTADKLKYELADIKKTIKEVTLPLATTTTNGLLSSSDYNKLRSTTLAGYGITDAFTWKRVISSTTTDDTALWGEIGIQTYGEVLPDGLTEQYNYGVLTSFNNNKGTGSQFQLYAPDYRGNNSIERRHIAWRTGFGANKGTWQRLANINTVNIFTESQTFQKQIKSTVATGTAPFSVASTTLVSNLNADMVDGYDSSVLLTCEAGYGIDVNAPHPKKELGTLLYRMSDNCANIPPSCTNGVLVHFNHPSTDTAFQLASNYSNTGLYYRSGTLNESGQAYLYNRAWKKVAFTDSNITGNAGTATKLQTARKIWGQSFDGTSDVSGGMTGVTLIKNTSGLSILSNGLGFAPENAGDLKGALTIGGSVNFGLAMWSDGSGKSYLQVGRTDDTNAAYNLILQHLGGNVGIGTASPTEKLLVNGNVKATSFLGNLDGTYINKLTGYSKATTIGSIAATDTLNTALGKLEFKTDFIYNDLFGTDNDDVINKWSEIVDFIGAVKEGTDITNEFVTIKTEQEITGKKWLQNIYVKCPYSKGGAANGISYYDINKTTRLGGIGGAYNDGVFSNLYIGWGDSPWDPYKNLSISESKLTYKNNIILDSSNYTNYKHSYTNLTGSTTIANQAIVSTGTENGWKLLTLGPGAFLDDYPMLTLGTLSDYVEYVLLLHPINGSTDWVLYYSYGTIYTHRSNGLNPCSSIIYNSIPKYDSTNVYVSMILQGRKYAQWCTCTYNKLKYCGLKLYTQANHSSDLTIKGRWNSDPILVKYKTNLKTDSNGNITSEEIIHNGEIANSIVVEGGDIIINPTYGKFNGTFNGNITGGTVTASKLITSGGTASGDIILKNSSGTAATPYLKFQRGSTNDSYVDWRFGNNNSGKLILQYNYNDTNATTETWNDVFVTTRTISTFNSALKVAGSLLTLGNSNGSILLFKRPSASYIWADEPGGYFVIGVKDTGSISTGNASLIIDKNLVYPGKRNNIVSLGTASYRWSNVYSVLGNFSGNVTASKFITSGGTASQFVKGDGSLDSNTYVSETEFPNLSSKGLYQILTGSSGSNINKWKKFARINLSSDKVYTQCGGYMFIYDHEGHHIKGILDFQVRTNPDTSINNSNINLQSPYLTWHILDNSNYASNIKMVKVENGIFDLYITTSQKYTTRVIEVFTPRSDKITLFDETWIDTLPENVICTSSYTITVPNAITASKLTSTTIVDSNNAFSLSSAEWVDTGYTFTNLATGTYAVQVTSGTNLVASGIMSVYKNLEDTKGDEIPLHVYGTAEWRPYLRTYKNKLLISSTDTSSTSRTVTIKIALIL